MTWASGFTLSRRCPGAGSGPVAGPGRRWHAPPGPLARRPGAADGGGREQRILQLAASIAEGFPVPLRDTVPGLDNRNFKLLTAAIRHTAGQHPRR